MTDEPATRREVDLLRMRLEQIDQLGTRGTSTGLALVTQQAAELIRDVGELRGQLAAHDQRHDREQRDRMTGRRWLIGTLIALAALLVAVLAIVIPLAAAHP